jgi:helicase
MRIAVLPVPRPLVQFYNEKGITELYPPQVECVKAGVFEGKNLLMAIPTASGKTLIAEMSMHHHIDRKGKCLYIVPLKALASEKYIEFGGKGVEVGIATGDLDRRDEFLGRNDLIIATSEKVDSLLRNNAPWLNTITLLVVDEIHLIDSEDRGATLEMVITKLRSLNPSMQIIGLSATIGNPGELGGWLDAEVVTSKWRPVDLREGVYHRGCIHFAESERAVLTQTKDDDINLCLDTLKEGGQCLLFVSSRRNAQAFSKRAAFALQLEGPKLSAASQQLERLAETEMGKMLAACVEKGSAFHHAGLKLKQRQIVEKEFREGNIKVIASTPTLAAGLNLPARRVIIRDYLRYQAGTGMTPIPVREYRQMAGRAGRPRLDPYGEAVLIAKQRNGIEELFEAYIEAPPEDISSQIASESALTTHLLSLVATRFVRSRDDLIAFMERTFYTYQKKKSRYLSRIIDNALDFLINAEMVMEREGFLSATPYGTLVSRLYIDPRSAEIITNTLMEERPFTEIGLLQLLCSTPDMFTLYVKKNDLPVLERYFFVHEEDLWMEFTFESGEDYYRNLKTALLLNDWIDEAGENTICDRWGIAPGDIYSAVEAINWLIHAASRLTSLRVPVYNSQIREMELRMKHGIKKELLPLVQLRGVGRVRARRLFNNNITGIEAIRLAGKDRIANILGKKIAEQIFVQVDRNEISRYVEEEEEDEDTQSTLLHFG